jgi:hemerythrin
MSTQEPVLNPSHAMPQVKPRVLVVEDELVFELTNALMAEQDVPTLRQLIMALYKHTREHFELEEAWMRKHDFPGMGEHVNYHNNLLTRLNAISQDVGQCVVNKPAIEQLMLDWAIRHTQHDDALIAAYIAKKA